MLGALLAYLFYRHYSTGRDLQCICELISPNEAGVTIPNFPRQEIDNICINHRADDASRIDNVSPTKRRKAQVVGEIVVLERYTTSVRFSPASRVRDAACDEDCLQLANGPHAGFGSCDTSNAGPNGAA
jgi:hypothetical protein